ncbi:hypothetical protein ACFY71_34335 [Streptomyces cinerochromogenes]|uniref:hypothetical protein n=1 Tax=Streptomyces cinerochromogenes TaxID=66422 RepID=UPI0036B02BAE
MVLLPAPLTGSEDFGVFGRELGAPSVFWHFGGADPLAFAGRDLASVRTEGLPKTVAANHSPRYAPVARPALESGITAFLAVAAEWLAESPA